VCSALRDAEVELDALAVGRLFQADAVLRWSASSVSVAGVVPAALRDVCTCVLILGADRRCAELWFCCSSRVGHTLVAHAACMSVCLCVCLSVCSSPLCLLLMIDRVDRRSIVRSRVLINSYMPSFDRSVPGYNDEQFPITIIF
jgi:hypothetical protein